MVGGGVGGCGGGLVDSVEPDGGDACEVGGADVAEGGVTDAECGAGVCAGLFEGFGVVFWGGFEVAEGGFAEYVGEVLCACVFGEGLGFLLGVAACAEAEGDAGFFEGVEGGDGVGDVDGCFLGGLVGFVEFLGEFLGCGVVVGGLEVLEWELGVEEHVVVVVEVLCVGDVSVDAVSLCVVELVAWLVEDAVDAVGDDGVVVVEGPVVVHQDGDNDSELGCCL